MKTGRFTSIWWIVVLVVGVYWVGYFVAVRPSSSPVVFSRNLPPDYRLPPFCDLPDGMLSARQPYYSHQGTKANESLGQAEHAADANRPFS
jgi:hypothetical protein